MKIAGFKQNGLTKEGMAGEYTGQKIRGLEKWSSGRFQAQ
jgi:hypothetical protein